MSKEQKRRPPSLFQSKDELGTADQTADPLHDPRMAYLQARIVGGAVPALWQEADEGIIQYAGKWIGGERGVLERRVYQTKHSSDVQMRQVRGRGGSSALGHGRSPGRDSLCLLVAGGMVGH